MYEKRFLGHIICTEGVDCNKDFFTSKDSVSGLNITLMKKHFPDSFKYVSNGFASDILTKKNKKYRRLTWNLPKVCWYFRFWRYRYFPEDIVKMVFLG